MHDACIIEERPRLSWGIPCHSNTVKFELYFPTLVCCTLIQSLGAFFMFYCVHQFVFAAIHYHSQQTFCQGTVSKPPSPNQQLKSVRRVGKLLSILSSSMMSFGRFDVYSMWSPCMCDIIFEDFHIPYNDKALDIVFNLQDLHVCGKGCFYKV